MNTPDFQRCAEKLTDWYTTHYRSLPWRDSPDAYRVWVSEIMLQQTRIEAVLPYYARFMQACPRVEDLAALPQERLLKLWEGLGYYSRARNLQKAARVIVDEYNGEFPADYDRLLALPGIGEYTAGAIASISFDIPVPAVDGNVMRVLSRLTGDETDVLSARAKQHYAAIVRRMLPTRGAGRFNQALMELGETVCLPRATPHCATCPWRDMCVARATDRTAELPHRAKKKPRRIEDRLVAVVCVAGDPPGVLLHKRAETGLLANLWELPNVLLNEENTVLPPQLLCLCRAEKELDVAKHIFSHVEWHMRGRLYRMPRAALPPDYTVATLTELRNDYALPSAFRAYAALLPSLLQQEGL